MKRRDEVIAEMATPDWWLKVPKTSDLFFNPLMPSISVTEVLIDGPSSESSLPRMIILIGNTSLRNREWDLDKRSNSWDCYGNFIDSDVWIEVNEGMLDDVPYPVRVSDDSVIEMINDILHMGEL